MPGDFDVLGGDQLKILGAKLKVADKKLRLQMAKTIRAATRPVIEKQHATALERLPRRGGLAALVARTPIRTSVLNGARGVSVTIRSSGKPPVRDVRAIDQGKLRHPVFGSNARRVAGARKDSIKADQWVSQDIPEGYFSDPVKESKTEIRAAVSEALAHTLKELT